MKIALIDFLSIHSKNLFSSNQKMLAKRIFELMSLPLRITFEERDYTYTILTKLITKETREIKISLNNEELTLFKNDKNEWDARERTVIDDAGLIKAIGRNVALRHRL